MIIDVVDLQYKTLSFNRRYDARRYQRGRVIYNGGLATVTSVDKKDDKNYIVKASVKGNYGIYTTTLKLCGNLITDSSCTCEDYNNGNLCKHIIATSMEVIEPHQASTRKGRKKLLEKQKEKMAKILEERRKRQEEERKRREYERKYSNSLRTIEWYKRNSNKENVTTLDLPEIYREANEQKNKKNGELATSVKLQYFIELVDNETLQLSFKIGQTRMYVLNDIDEFYEAYKKETEIYYGKQLSLIPKRENFEEDSIWIFDLIIKYAKIAQYSNKYNSYNSYYGSYNHTNSIGKFIYISGEDIDEFLDMNKNKEILLNVHYGRSEIYRFTDEKLNIYCELKKEKVEIPTYNFFDDKEESEEYVLKINIKNYLILLSQSKIYIFYQNKIYTMNKEKELLELLDLFKTDDEILIPEDKLKDFERYVIPKIKYVKTELPEEVVKEGLIVDKLSSKVFLDVDDRGNIILELKFSYKNGEFNVLENGYKTYVKEHNIVRDIPAETEVLRNIFMDGFEPVSGRKEFVMKNTDDIYDLLSQKINRYLNEFEVFATDKFKNKQIMKPKISNIGIKIDNGLLELDISKINIDISEIKDILKDYHIKKKYHKLKDGNFLDLSNNENLNLLDEMEETLDIDYSKVKEGKVNLPISRSLYLKKLMDSNKDITVSKNDKFTEIVNGIESSESSEKIKIDKDFEKILRDYQKVGYRWLKTLEKYRLGGILADDMGLRKNFANYYTIKIRNKI